MTKKEAAAYLVKALGLTEEEAKVITAKATDEQLDGIAARAELDALNAQKTALEAEAASAKQYQEWYTKNAQAIKDLQTGYARYQERYGALDAGDTGAGTGTGGDKVFSKDDAQRLVDEQLKAKDAMYARAIVSMTKITDRHTRSKLDKPLDVDAITKLASEKYNDNLELAYDEWIKPDVEAKHKADTEAEITRRVNEEVQKRTSGLAVPGTGDFDGGSTGTGLFRRSDDKVSADELRRGLLETARTGKYEPTRVQ